MVAPAATFSTPAPAVVKPEARVLPAPTIKLPPELTLTPLPLLLIVDAAPSTVKLEPDTVTEFRVNAEPVVTVPANRPT
jgi:hypothetical protein